MILFLSRFTFLITLSPANIKVILHSLAFGVKPSRSHSGRGMELNCTGGPGFTMKWIIAGNMNIGLIFLLGYN